ncbi:MAG TPA: hypothetical protein VMU42_20160 [Candidatus Sulfotelmatobacter sp.]|nr:hypothetical protein [Candidatus Sulfotelmatobacter sp.]
MGLFLKSIAGLSVLVLILLWLNAHPYHANPFGKPAAPSERGTDWSGWQ